MKLFPTRQLQLDVALTPEQVLERLSGALAPTPKGLGSTAWSSAQPARPLMGQVRPDGTFEVYANRVSGGTLRALCAGKVTHHGAGSRVEGTLSYPGVGALLGLFGGGFTGCFWGIAILSRDWVFLLPGALPLLPWGILALAFYADDVDSRVRNVLMA